MKNFFTKDRNFYRRYGVMTAVMAGQSLITYGVNLADNVMVGGYSQTALAAVAVVNQLQFLLQMMVNGLVNGMVVLGAQYWGKRQTEPIRKITGGAMLISLGVSGLMLLLMMAFPHTILRLITNEPAVVEEAIKYMRIVAFSYPLFAATQVLLGSLRSVETVRIGFLVTVTALAVNVVLNYAMIYGRLGFPAMGVEGAAWATLISRAVELLVAGWYALCIDKRLKLKFTELFSCEKGLFRDYVKVTTPLFLSGLSWGTAMTVQASILGHLGEAAIAANSIAATVHQVVSVAAYAGAGASSVLIGKAVGQDNMEQLKSYVRTLQMIYAITGIVSGSVLYLCRGLILGLYSIDSATYRLAEQFTMVLAVTLVGTSYQVSCLTGIVTGGGNTRFVFINDLIHMWGLVLPVSALSAFVFHWPLWLTFACLKSDQILKCGVACFTVNRYRWIRKLTRKTADEKA